MDVAVAVVVCAAGGALSGYFLKADGVPEWTRWLIPGLILVGMATILGINVTAADSPEAFISDNWWKFGFPGLVAVVACGLAYMATAEAMSKRPGSPS